VADVPLREIAGRCPVSRSALHRHKQEHLPAHLAKAHEEESIGQAIDVVRQLKAINAACLEILQSSRADKKHAISLKAVDRIQKQIELQARLLGELQETGPTVNVLVAPEWRELRVTVLQALTPYPEARAAVAEVLTDARQ
ncbi:MAG TPA: hypothetical protein VLF66_09110, partial [Thermoanaerobaculia bacterium]|nr:hypothetical protein [Thermoanaerobaculia bacterium]